MRPDKEFIENVLKNVKAERERLPEFSAFGDENWEIADKQIEILEASLKGNFPEDYEEYDNEKDYQIWGLCEWLTDTEYSDFGYDYSD